MTSQPIHQVLQTALAHHQAGRLPQAEALYRQVLVYVPNHHEALHLLGVLAHQVGQQVPAAELIQRAIAGNPSDARYHGNLGRVLSAMNKPADAVLAYRVSLSLDPAPADIWYNLGNALQLTGDHDEAIKAFQQSVERKPDFADAWNNLGTALESGRQHEQAIPAFRRAIELQPQLAEAHNNLGNVLRDVGQLEEAVAACRRAIDLQPDYFQAHNNLGGALLQQRKIDDAIAAFQKSLSLNPEFPYAHLNMGLALLLKGNLRAGLEHYEWRWNLGVLKEYLSDVKQPKWDGSDLGGRRILVHAEQGFGDTIQFIRYIPQVAARGGKVSFICPSHLIRLLEGFPGIDQLIPNGQPLPEFDVHCPLLSLPYIFGITVEMIPADVPYLRADPARSRRWDKKLAKGLKRVGLVWAGRASNNNDRNRSLNLSAFESLKSIEGMTFYSLQKGDPARQVQSSRPAVIDCSAELEDFTDTAAVIDNLDLLVTVDTAAAHLAGAMGKPVWMLVPYFPDWRWMLERTDSPWYPTMRLFRQPVAGDWETPIAQIVQELRCLK